jgi:hypothetical protein
LKASQSLSWVWHTGDLVQNRRFCASQPAVPNNNMALQWRISICYPPERLQNCGIAIVWAGRRLAALKKREQTAGSNHTHELAQNELRIVPIVNDALVWVLLQEARLVGRRHRLPVGTSLLVVAEKV